MPEDRDLFLSYNTNDRNAVLAVRRELETLGISSFYDKEDLTPGLSWMDELELSLQHVRAVAIFIGPHGLGLIQKREFQFAFLRQVNSERLDQRLPVIPILLDGVDEAAITGMLALNTWVDL